MALPTYDLTCEDCSEQFEIFVMRMLRDGDKICPRCGSNRVKTGLGGGVLKAGTSTSSDAACAPGAFT